MLKQSYFWIMIKVADEAIRKKIFKRSRLDIRKFAFSNRIVDRWNSLSECCVTCNSVFFFFSYACH